MKDLSLNAEMLLQAYAAGVFPMAEGQDSEEIFWVDPKRRGVLPLDGFHISRSLARRMRKGGYEVTFDADFAGVVDACADREETWINAQIRELCCDLHAAGYAHSVEVRQDGKLTGGVYGVALGAAFFGESMFSRATDASKIALAYLVDRLRGAGFTLFDTQFITPHLGSLGAVEITRREYRALLDAALARSARFPTDESVPAAQDVLQRNTQMS